MRTDHSPPLSTERKEGSAISVVLVLIGGAIGAVARYLTDLGVQHRHRSRLPWGTWWVNVTGSAVLGVVGAAATTGSLGPDAVTFVGTGICGALTTFSTFGYETLRLIEGRAVRSAALNVVGSVLAGLVACALGWDIAAWVLGG